MTVINQVKEIVEESILNTEYSLYNIEYVKESGEYFLRIYFDKVGGLDLDDCVFLSEKIAKILDEKDPIKDKYYLEVSSPGVERELRNIDEVIDSIGKYVFIKTYEKIDNEKEFYGHILKVEREDIVLKIKNKTKFVEKIIDYKKIAKIRLAVEI